MAWRPINVDEPVMTVGIDLTSTTLWERRLKHAPAISDVAFSLPERWWCERSAARHAFVWAIKEAVVKLLGTGFGDVGWQDVTVQPSLSAPGLIAEALQVTLAPTAREACRSTSFSQPLRFQVRHDGEHVLAVLAAGPGRVAVEEQVVETMHPCCIGGNPHRYTPSTPGEARRIAAREAGRRALARLAEGPARWNTPRNARPTVRWPCGATSAVSFTHTGDLAYAVVQDTCTTDLQAIAPFPLVFHHDKSLLADMQTTRQWTDIGDGRQAWFTQSELTASTRLAPTGTGEAGHCRTGS